MLTPFLIACRCNRWSIHNSWLWTVNCHYKSSHTSIFIWKHLAKSLIHPWLQDLYLLTEGKKTLHFKCLYSLRLALYDMHHSVMVDVNAFNYVRAILNYISFW